MPSYFGARRALFAAPYSGPLAFNPATQSPTSTSPLTFSNNNTTVYDGGANGNPHTVKTYYPKYSGKWFIEFYINTAFLTYLGVGTANYDTNANNGNDWVGTRTNGISYYSDASASAGIYYNSSTYFSAPLYFNGDRISITYDLTGPFIVVTFYRNGGLASTAFTGGVWGSSEGAVPIWSDIRTGTSGTVVTTPTYTFAGFTYLGPG